MSTIVTHKGTNLNWVAYKLGDNPFTIDLSDSELDLSDHVFVLNITRIGDTTNVLQLTEADGIVNNGAAGTLDIDLTKTKIDTYLPGNDYWYEIAYTLDGAVIPLFQGTLTLYNKNNPGSPSTITPTVNLGDVQVIATVTLAGGSGASTAEEVSFTPTENIVAENVQDAIEELDSEKASKAYADAKVAQTITNGVTTSAPSQDAVSDALDSKSPKNAPVFTGGMTSSGDVSFTSDGELVNVIINDDGILMNGQPLALYIDVAAKVAQTITNGVTTSAPSQDAVFDALALKANTANVFTTVILGSNVTNNNATPDTLADITGLSFAVVNGGVYYFTAFIVYTAAAGTGSRFTLNGPTFSKLAAYYENALSATTVTVRPAIDSYATPSAASATSSGEDFNVARIEGTIKTTAAGTMQVQFASEVAGSAVVAISEVSFIQYLRLS